MRTSGGYFEGAFGVLLAADFGEVQNVLRCVAITQVGRLRRRQDDIAPEVDDQIAQ